MEAKIANIKTTKYLLDKYNLSAKKSLGQNFIVDSNIIDRLVAHAEIDETVAIIEIGPGLGALTQALLEKAPKVVSIEIDQNMVAILEQLFVDKENFRLINADILKFDLESLINELSQDYQKIMLVANLPYYITSDILLKLFQLENKVTSVMLMVQKEFAQRLTADKNNKDYRTLTVLSKTFYDSKIMMKISKHVFYPRPNVDSAIILMKSIPSGITDSEVWINFIEMCFTQKRKTIYNNLRNNLDAKLSNKILAASEVSPKLRPAELDVEEFKKMYEVYYEKQIICKD